MQCKLVDAIRVYETSSGRWSRTAKTYRIKMVSLRASKFTFHLLLQLHLDTIHIDIMHNQTDMDSEH